MKATSVPPKRKEGVETGQYRLPASLCRLVRIEAAERDVWPSVVVAERLSDSFRRKPFKPPQAES